MRIELDDADLDRLADLVAQRVVARLGEQKSDEGWLDSSAAAEYVGISKNALHKLTAARKIPFEQNQQGGKCYFRRSDLDRWRSGTS